MVTVKKVNVKLSIVLALVTLAGNAFGISGNADVTIGKPYFRWLFGGFGFQHSEANFMALMPDDFRDQRVLKTFAELSPTFGRVYTGFADQSKEQLDRFVEYYDMTFRKAGTTLYAVPCAMPGFADKIDSDEYAEKVAKNLEYLIKGRKCRKIRYYCLTNELMSGDNWGWFGFGGEDRYMLFRKFYASLFYAFRKHGLDINLLATDESALSNVDGVFKFLDWIKDNGMDDYVGGYCTHFYARRRDVDDLGLWNEHNEYFSRLVQLALSRKCKRYILGEYGFKPRYTLGSVMREDVNFPLCLSSSEEECVLSKCEIGLAAMNQGAYACLDWSFVDYPDPFVVEDGDTTVEHATYEAGKCGYRMDVKYNKFGVFRWCSTDRDYSAYAELYAMGWLVKLFRKNATILNCTFADPLLRGGAVMNPDRSVSITLINRGQERTVNVDCTSWKSRIDGTPSFHQPLREYAYVVGKVPYSPFNDLQPVAGVLDAKEGAFSVKLPAKSMVFLTTDYQDRKPAAIADVRIVDGKLVWSASKEPEHCYYRVYRDGKQIASTVATSLDLGGLQFTATETDAMNCVPPVFAVRSVDKWGNVGE